MADVFTKEKRSAVMSSIRSRGNKDTEGAMRLLLRTAEIRGWRRHSEIRIAKASFRAGQRGQKKTAPFKVRPDFVFPKEKVALFVDGCFWHGCPWHGTKPASNKSFWREKLTRNKNRDTLVTRTLRKAGWKVLRIWEHTLPRAARDPKELEKLLARIRRYLHQERA